MPAISERVARWVARLGLATLIGTIVIAVMRRWGHTATLSMVEVGAGVGGLLLTAYGAAVCAWWRRDQRRREREEFERLLSNGANRYSG
jgi:hypothetical protein